MQFRDYTFLGTTESLCPECLSLVPAKIIARGERVYFRKRCPVHGEREDFVCSDVHWFDRTDYSQPGKVPPKFGLQPRRGCPFDCGLCTDHEQHTCVGVLEITSSCNLTCPMCYAASAPGGEHLSVDACREAINRLVETEGRAEVLQLSGGEPTVHPQFLEIFRYACDQPIDIVMINTNGIRLARDPELLAEVAAMKHRCEVYLQFDSFEDDTILQLRGESLLETKLRAIEALGEAGVRVILVCTLQAGLNDHEMGRLVEFGIERPWITGVSFQPATYSGRYVLPEHLERRITFPDVIKGVASQTGGLWRENDFIPLPCAHPNGHSLAYACRTGDRCIPMTRFIDVANHLDLLSNGITFNRLKAHELVSEVMSRQCCEGGSCTPSVESDSSHGLPLSNGSGQHTLPARWQSGELGAPNGHAELSRSEAQYIEHVAQEFFTQAMAEDLTPADVFRITTTSFMDAYNFDIRQLMMSCIHHVLPSGHLIPFSAYNVLYREGHIPLPTLEDRCLTAVAESR